MEKIATDIFSKQFELRKKDLRSEFVSQKEIKKIFMDKKSKEPDFQQVFKEYGH